jgi:hypothetical protein
MTGNSAFLQQGRNDRSFCILQQQINDRIICNYTAAKK